MVTPDAITASTRVLQLMVNPGASRHRTWSDLVSLQAGQAVGVGAGLASVAVLSRLLGPADYGRLALVMTAAQYAMTIGVSWTSAALIRFGREAYLRSGRLGDVFWTRLILTAPSVGILVVALYILRAPLSRVLPVTQVPLTVVCLAFVVMMLADQADGTLQATAQWTTFAWLNTLEKGTLIVIVTSVALLAGISVRIAVLAVIASQAVRSAIAFWTARRSLSTDSGISRSAVGAAIVRYSWPQVFTFTIGYASAAIEPFLIR